MAYIPPLNGGRVNIGAGGVTASTGTVNFSNANGVTFGMAGNTMTASVAAAGNNFVAGISTNGNTLGSTGLASNQLMMVGGNNITLSQSVGTGASSGNNTLTIVGPTQSAQTQSNVQAIIGQGGTASTGSVSFANANGVSFSMAGNVMSASVAAGGNNIFGLSNLGNTSGTSGVVNGSAVQYLLAGGNNVTLSQSLNGLSGTVTINAQSQSAQTQSNVQAIIAAGSTASTGSVSFANSNGIGFGMNGNTMTASHNALTSQSAQTQSVIQGFYDGAVSISSGTIMLQDGNGVSFGLVGNTMTASVAPGVALAGGVAGTSTTITNGTANLSVGGGAMTISGSNQSLNFYVPGTSSLVGTNGISLSANGGTISIGGVAGGGGVTLSRWEYPLEVFTSIGALGQSSLSVQHVYVPFNVTGTAAKIAASISLSTFTSASTGSVNNSLWMGVYTLNGSTLSLSASGSAVNILSWGNTASSATYTNLMSGLRQLTVPISLNMPAGEYWVAALNVSGSTFASASMSLMGNNQIATLGQIGVLGSSSSIGRDVFLGQGIFSANTTAMPTSIVLSNINNAAASNAMRAAFYHVILNAVY